METAYPETVSFATWLKPSWKYAAPVSYKHFSSSHPIFPKNFVWRKNPKYFWQIL